jgi:glycosyltransferase involved in cell wall biosynthesis
MPAVVTVFGLEPRYIGGSESYARELSIQLASHGWRSVLCFLSWPPDAVRRYLDLPNVSLEVLENSDDGYPSLATMRKLSTILRTHQANVLHLQLVGFLSPYPWLARLHSVKQVFFTHHGSYPEAYVPRRARLWKRMLARAINRPMSRIICVSDYNYRCLTSVDLLPAKRFTRIYNGVDFSRVSTAVRERAVAFRRKHGIAVERTLVSQVSWLIPEKGVGDLLQAARLVVAENPNITFAFVGEGAHRESFRRQAAEMGLGDHTIWTGLVSDPFAEGVYDAADIVCQPSRWEEAFGQTIAEAMACSKPVIGTRVGGISELIEDGVSGVLVLRGDVSALAAKILLLAGKPELRERMGLAGRVIAQKKFDLRENVRRLVQLYIADRNAS